MARSISLSDEAFRVLRTIKEEGESDSDVVLRLAREARKKRKDPMAFLERRPRHRWDANTYDELREEMRQADIKKAKRLDTQRESED